MYFFGMKCSKSLRFLGLRPRPAGKLTTPPDPLAARGFLPSAIAASHLRRLQFPHRVKSNFIKERWPMKLGGGNLRQRSWGGIDAPVCMHAFVYVAYVHVGRP